MTTYGKLASDEILKEALKGLKQKTEEGYMGPGILVSVVYDGAIEDEISIAAEDWQTIGFQELVARLQTALNKWGQSKTEVWTSEVFIDEKIAESTGYTDYNTVLYFEGLDEIHGLED